ncbi:hypothetical protein DXG01_007467, partial [Tephrocybe rancida]
SHLDPRGNSNTRLIAPGIIARVAIDGQTATVPSEYLALRRVHEFTTIPVPHVHRLVSVKRVDFIIMDYVPGPSLLQSWPAMSEEEMMCVSEILHGYVLQLRALRHDVPGPPAPGREAWVCTESSLFGGVVEIHGPFPSYSALSDFFNKRQQMTLDPSNLRNIILGNDGRLWLLDWGCAGFYPEWFEYACMKQQAEDKMSIGKGKDGCGGSDEVWDRFVEVVCGENYKAQYEWYKKMSWTLYYL